MGRMAKNQASLGRSATRELRRQQLIEATIDAIAKRGFADTTMADVAAGAGLSQGIVNFHFHSKEELLLETLRFISEEYREIWRKALATAGPGQAGRLWSVLAADFDRRVCSRKKIAVWHAFYGEAKARPTYQKICGARDDERCDVMAEIIEAMTAEAGYRGLDAEALALLLTAMTDGLWLDFHLSAGRLDREAACRRTRMLLARLFPAHFDEAERTAA